jgi:hypothetical protein
MRPFLYAVAAVLALAPLAAAAPASAAVQHPAAAQVDNCSTGLWVDPSNGTAAEEFDWLVESSSAVEAAGSSGEVVDETAASTPRFCQIAGQAGYFAFRERGTNQCATWDQKASPDNTVQMFKCSPLTVTAQNWYFSGPDGTTTTMTTELNNGESILGGTGGDAAVYMAGNPPNHEWKVADY